MSLKTNLFRFIFISVLGVLLHFTYEWSGDCLLYTSPSPRDA